jgi:hypothetical protein
VDVFAWLRELGFGQYEGAFRDNAIDERVLPSLTADDLKEIGIGPVGHRRLLLEAIAALRNDAQGAPVPQEKPRPLEPATPSAPRDSAERRPITVMFCDLVGSTALEASSR